VQAAAWQVYTRNDITLPPPRTKRRVHPQWIRSPKELPSCDVMEHDGAAIQFWKPRCSEQSACI